MAEGCKRKGMHKSMLTTHTRALENGPEVVGSMAKFSKHESLCCEKRLIGREQSNVWYK
jgi:hypothetical protein